DAEIPRLAERYCPGCRNLQEGPGPKPGMNGFLAPGLNPACPRFLFYRYGLFETHNAARHIDHELSFFDKITLQAHNGKHRVLYYLKGCCYRSHKIRKDNQIIPHGLLGCERFRSAINPGQP